MRRRLPLKNNQLLWLGAIALLLLSYQLAFKKTLEAWQTHTQLQTQLGSSEALAIQPDFLWRKRNNLTKIISFYQTDTAAFRSLTLSKISILADQENVKLSEVPTEDTFLHTEQFILQHLNFEGDFFALTRLLNKLQSLRNIGMIRSISYKTRKNTDGTDQKVIMELYFELVK